MTYRLDRYEDSCPAGDGLDFRAPFPLHPSPLDRRQGVCAPLRPHRALEPGPRSFRHHPNSPNPTPKPTPVRNAG